MALSNFGWKCGFIKFCLKMRTRLVKWGFIKLRENVCKDITLPYIALWFYQMLPKKVFFNQILRENVCIMVLSFFCLKMWLITFYLKMCARLKPYGFIKFCLKMWLYQILPEKFGFIKFCLKMSTKACLKMCA